MKKGLASTAVCALLLYGCESTPVPQLSPQDVPAGFEQPAAADASVWPAQDWWKGFGDAQLAALIEQRLPEFLAASTDRRPGVVVLKSRILQTT